METPITDARARLVIESIDEVVWFATADLSRMVYVNPAYERVWGRSCESLYREPSSFIDAVHPDDRASLLRAFSVKPRGVPFAHEYRIVRPDGTERWISDRGYPVHDASGAVEHYVGVARDVTERKRAEQELTALAERFQLVSRATRDGIWDWDIVANTAWWSEAYFDELGYGRTVTPSYQAWVDRVHPDDRERVLQSFARVLEGGTSIWTEEYRFLMPDGTALRVFDRAYVLHDENGRPIRMVGALMNVEDQRTLEAQLRQSQKMEIVGRLAGGVAHDFNNVLQAMVMQLDLLASERGLSTSAMNHLRELRGTIERATGLTRPLLVFSRLEQMKRSWIDLETTTTDLARMLRRLLGEEILLQLQLAPGTLRVFADGGMIDQVIMNLALNARDAMPRGGTLTITTSSVERAAEGQRAAGRHACLSVRDTGTGIPADVLPRIFEPFFTTKDAERGTGLGLAIASGIVEQHGGFIEVETSETGSEFRVLLPLAGPPVVEMPKDEPETRALRGGETILLVEDDASIRRLTRAVLEGYGYQIVEADSAASALQECEARRGAIHLVLTDVIMVGMNGVELAKELRARCPKIKVILTTGYSRRVDTGAHTVLHKPILPRNLLAAVRACLDEKDEKSQ